MQNHIVNRTRPAGRSALTAGKAAAVLVGVLGVVGVGGCSAPPPELTAPQVTTAPYEAPQGEVVWAVVPLRNESGTTAIDPLALSDKLVAAVEEVRGVRCLPLNRTLETMRAMRLNAVGAPGDIGALAAALNADALVVGTITAYDPYTPSIGLSLVLWARPGSAMDGHGPSGGVDARRLQGATGEPAPSRTRRNDGVVASASEHLDGKNHQVLMDVRSFAAGRHNPTDAMNWRRYTASMPLYEEFAASFMVSRLLQQEWLRLGRTVPVAQAGEGGTTPSGE